jgi:cob(I)alamin adenosyltransferase
MGIYTRTGDEGTTGRPDGCRRRKSDPVVAAVGDLDELNSHVGLCLAAARSGGADRIVEALEPVQSELLAAGAALAAVGSSAPPAASPTDADVTRLERQIDALSADLPELDSFIRPAGTELACRLHVARTVCRRAERAAAIADDASPTIPPVVKAYLNRLSDLLFAAARAANRAAGVEEQPWRP